MIRKTPLFLRLSGGGDAKEQDDDDSNEEEATKVLVVVRAIISTFVWFSRLVWHAVVLVCDECAVSQSVVVVMR